LLYCKRVFHALGKEAIVQLRIAGILCAFAIHPFPALADPAPAMHADASPPAVSDAVRLEAARNVVKALLPEGTYGKIMKSTMDGLMGSVMDQVKSMPLRELAGMTGQPQQKLAQLGPGTLGQIMEIYDPAFNQRSQIMMNVMMGEMTTMMSQMEPEIRDSLSRTYARKFSTDQLMELNHFFATSTGSLYASQSMTMVAEPEMLAKMREMVPRMMNQMPATMQHVRDATADLPPPKQFGQLTAAERAKLARLLGVPVQSLSRSRH
jgi:hypothetical protein